MIMEDLENELLCSGSAKAADAVSGEGDEHAATTEDEEDDVMLAPVTWHGYKSGMSGYASVM